VRWHSSGRTSIDTVSGRSEFRRLLAGESSVSDRQTLPPVEGERDNPRDGAVRAQAHNYLGTLARAAPKRAVTSFAAAASAERIPHEVLAGEEDSCAVMAEELE
jgi:hypothetical protein